MTKAITWRILVVDDEPKICEQIVGFFGKQSLPNGDRFEFEVLNQFGEATELLERRKFDLVILDIRENGEDEEAGVKVLEEIKARCFIPVVFYSGLAHTVKDKESGVVKAVRKDAGVYDLFQVVTGIFQNGVPTLNRSLFEHVQNVHKDYMWKFSESDWELFNGVPDSYELAYLMGRRLSLSFSSYGIKQLAQSLPITPDEPIQGSPYEKISDFEISPLHYYVVPPMFDKPLTGDIYRGEIGDKHAYWLLLTPSCDFWQNKAEYVLLAECAPLTESIEYKNWGGAQKKEKDFAKFLRNGKNDRTFFLPAFLQYPHLVADFQKLVCPTIDEFNCLERIANLDSTFASEAVSKFLRHYARRGTPDLNPSLIMEQLRYKDTAATVEPASIGE